MIKEKGAYIKDIENAKELRNVYNIETFKKREEACRTIIDGTRFINIPDWMIDLYCATGRVLRYWTRVGSVGDYDTFGEFSRRYIEAINEFNKLIREHRDVLV